jgi:hypothetical protein
MLFKYSTTSQTHNEFDRLPRVPISLSRADQRIESVGLVDSGATVNVLPYGGVSQSHHSINRQPQQSVSDAFLCDRSYRRVSTH